MRIEPVSGNRIRIFSNDGKVYLDLIENPMIEKFTVNVLLKKQEIRLDSDEIRNTVDIDRRGNVFWITGRQ